jgi:hypothetical protein
MAGLTPNLITAHGATGAMDYPILSGQVNTGWIQPHVLCACALLAAGKNNLCSMSNLRNLASCAIPIT